jgi:transposase InsO family protein
MYAAVESIVRDNAVSLAAACDVLGVCRSAYDPWQLAEPGARQRELDELTPTIVAIFLKHRRRYGARQIAHELRDRGIVGSPRRVANGLKIQGLHAIQPRSFVPRTTQGRHALGYSPNLLLDRKDPVGINELWVGDITYLPLRSGGFCYLAGLMDRYSRDIVGWSIAATMTESLVLDVLGQAIRGRRPAAGLIHHSDRGGQYAGTAYRAVLSRAGMCQSMSRADNGDDNAFMESCWGTLKRELAMADYEGVESTRAIVGEYVRPIRAEALAARLPEPTPVRNPGLGQRISTSTVRGIVCISRNPRIRRR